jgi:hypothetical protein
MENIINYTIIDQNMVRAIVRKNDDNTAHLFNIDNDTYTYWCTFDEWWAQIPHKDLEEAAFRYHAWMNTIAV